MSPDVWPLATRRKRRDGTFRMPWLRTSRPCVRSASRFRSRTRRSITWKSPHRDLVLGGPYCGFKPFFPLPASAVPQPRGGGRPPRFRSHTRRPITWKSPHRNLVLGGPYCGFKPFFPLATSAVRRRCFVAVADCCPSGGDRPGKWGTTMGYSAAPDFSLHLDPVGQCLCVAPLHLYPSFPVNMSRKAV